MNAVANTDRGGESVTVGGRLAIVAANGDGFSIYCADPRSCLMLDDEGNWDSYRGQNKRWPTYAAAESFLAAHSDKPASPASVPASPNLIAELRAAYEHHQAVQARGHSTYIKDTGRNGGSPWAELMDAVKAIINGR